MMAVDCEMYSESKFSMFATKRNIKLSKYFANITVILYSATTIFHSSNILIKLVSDDTAFNVSTKLLILEMDLPFDTNRRFVYKLVILVQFLHLLLCGDANGLLNALLINLVSIVTEKKIIIVTVMNSISLFFILLIKINFFVDGVHVQH